VPIGEAIAGNPLLARDPATLFSRDYMDGLVGSQHAGAGTPELRAAMAALAHDPKEPNLSQALRAVAAARGQPDETIRAQYDRFLAVRQQAAANAAANDLDAPPALWDRNMAFMGSEVQLRYGQVVGDAFGLDPVFGALLNPTGGMPGYGNLAVIPDSESALGYHGVMHDAGGYLRAYHGTGPGYNYLGAEQGSPAHPLTGQVSGVYYWTARVSPQDLTALQVAHGVISSSRGTAEVLNLLVGSRIF
jgi:hypothetical protein